MRSRSLAPVFILLLSLAVSFGQPKSELRPPPPLEPAEGERQARALLANLLSQRPEQNMTNTGVLKIRNSEGNQREVPVKIEVVPAPTNWVDTYEAAGTGNSPGEKLTIIHADGQPNQYFLSKPASSGATDPGPKKLTSGELMIPFAGSDFWVADLGLEFLHWPQQRVLKKQMRKNLNCDVLQSTNLQPVPGGYSRVVSWVAINRPDEIVIVHAEAYDAQNKLLKEFDPKKLQRVNGALQLEEVQMVNRQTGSRTRIDFNLKSGEGER